MVCLSRTRLRQTNHSMLAALSLLAQLPRRNFASVPAQPLGTLARARPVDVARIWESGGSCSTRCMFRLGLSIPGWDGRPGVWVAIRNRPKFATKYAIRTRKLCRKGAPRRQMRQSSGSGTKDGSGIETETQDLADVEESGTDTYPGKDLGILGVQVRPETCFVSCCRLFCLFMCYKLFMFEPRHCLESQGATRKRALIWLYIYIYIYTCIHIYTYKNMYIYIYMHACMHACMHIYIHTYVHLSLSIYIYIHTHTYTYTYIYIYIYIYV